MLRHFRSRLIVALLIPGLLAAGAAAETPVNLVVDGKAIESDVPPFLVEGRVMVPLRWVSQALGSSVHWDQKTQTAFVSQASWTESIISALTRAGSDPAVPGPVTGLWPVASGRILVRFGEDRDASFFLYRRGAGEPEFLISLVETPVLEEIRPEQITFVAAGGYDTGAWVFPYRVTYDLASGSSSTSPIFLKRSAAFGSTGAWRHLLEEVRVLPGEIQLVMTVPPEVVRAGGHKAPLTFATFGGDTVTFHIFGVETAGDLPVQPASGQVIEGVEVEDIGPEAPLEDRTLLEEGFPYGAAGRSPSPHDPSVRVTVRLGGNYGYNVQTETGDDDSLLFRISFR